MQTVELLEQVRRLRAKAEAALKAVETPEALEEIRRQFLGRKGELNALLRSLAQLPPEERRVVGVEANALREWLEEAFRQQEEQLRQRVLQQRLAKERLDVTLP